MDTIYSIHNVWIKKIFSGEKTIEFRTKLPKDFKIGDKIYFYETSKYNGRKMIVGECEVDYIIDILSKDGKWPICGFYPFLEYYFENIKKDLAVAEQYRKVKEEFEYKFENYRYGFVSRYAFSEEDLKSLREHGEPVNYWDVESFEKLDKHLKDIEKSENYEKECDEWLGRIGLYNEMGETYYKYGIVLKNVKEYKEPKPLSDFYDKNNKPIVKAPQSWMYTNGLINNK